LPRVFSDNRDPQILPTPPFKKGEHYGELLLKSPFRKSDSGGFGNRQMEGISGKRYNFWQYSAKVIKGTTGFGMLVKSAA
jgi:hypothetical protein